MVDGEEGKPPDPSPPIYIPGLCGRGVENPKTTTSETIFQHRYDVMTAPSSRSGNDLPASPAWTTTIQTSESHQNVLLGQGNLAELPNSCPSNSENRGLINLKPRRRLDPLIDVNMDRGMRRFDDPAGVGPGVTQPATCPCMPHLDDLRFDRGCPGLGEVGSIDLSGPADCRILRFIPVGSYVVWPGRRFLGSPSPSEMFRKSVSLRSACPCF